MDEILPSPKEKGLRNLMKGSGYDKNIAEKTLIDAGPDAFLPDILDIWLNSKRPYDKARAERVLESWGKIEKKE